MQAIELACLNKQLRDTVQKVFQNRINTVEYPEGNTNKPGFRIAGS